MDAFGKQLHMRGSVYEVRHASGPAYMLPLIERVRERSYESRIEAVFVGEAATAWVEQHRSHLRAGATLNDLNLIDIRIRNDVLTALVLTPPTLAPPRHPAASTSPPTTQAAAA